jgi:ribosome-binding protein aMBF1 (putative translation factor)
MKMSMKACTLCGDRPQDTGCPVLIDEVSENVCAKCYADIKHDQALEDDKAVVKSVWKSAHAVEDWQGKVTIRRFSPFKKVKVEGEGKTETEAWRVVADKIRAIWAE